MKMTTQVLLAAALTLLPLSGRAADAKENWTAQCQKCHGADGTGNTPVGKMLKIRNLTDAALQDGLTDDAIAEAIRNGIKNDKGKLVMPALAEKIAPEDIAPLVSYVRSLRAK